MPPAAHRTRAFTLMETTVAGAIVAVLLTGLFVLELGHAAPAALQRRNHQRQRSTSRQRVEQVRLANWNQITDPAWVQANLLDAPTDADLNLPGLRKRSPPRPTFPPAPPRPRPRRRPPFTVSRLADGTTSVSPAG